MSSFDIRSAHQYVHIFADYTAAQSDLTLVAGVDQKRLVLQDIFFSSDAIQTVQFKQINAASVITDFSHKIYVGANEPFRLFDLDWRFDVGSGLVIETTTAVNHGFDLSYYMVSEKAGRQH